jgi:pimeloyl-ACP methyl ester carboxylesterase
MITLGSGPPLVVIPGLDGHCTWMRPAIEALARHLTVTTFSLCGERDSRWRFDDAAGFDGHLGQVDEAVSRSSHRRAAILGVSYGGWVALRYVTQYPQRSAALVLVSSPPPGFVPNRRQLRHLRGPIRSTPAFLLRAPQRALPEIFAALPGWRDRVRFLTTHLARVARTGMSPTRMARRMHLAKRVDFFEACRSVTVPTLIVTGQPGLDRVVPVEETRKYLTLIPGAELVMLPRTGHMGSLTRPDMYADAVARFVARAAEDRHPLARGLRVAAAHF